MEYEKYKRMIEILINLFLEIITSYFNRFQNHFLLIHNDAPEA
jgi:hypothetical protein